MQAIVRTSFALYTNKSSSRAVGNIMVSICTTTPSRLSRIARPSLRVHREPQVPVFLQLTASLFKSLES